MALPGLGKRGRLKFEERFDCRDIDLVACDRDRSESDASDGSPCSWNAVHADNVGELGVNDARSADIRRFDVNEEALDGLESLWFETNLTPGCVGASSLSPDSSAIPCMILGLVGLLGGGPRICGVSVDIRTQFCLRCPFLAFGLPFNAEGFGNVGSH